MMVHHLRGFHGQGIQLSSCFNDLRSSSPIGPPSWQNTKMAAIQLDVIHRYTT